MALPELKIGEIVGGFVWGLVVIAVIVGLFFLFMYIRNQRKKIKTTSKKASNKKESSKNTTSSDIQEISGNNILIRVYKDFGSNTQILKAEYPAMETRDSFNNLISINTDFSHNENTDFSIDDVYREMQIILEFKNKPKEEKLKILQTKIEKQDKILRYLEKYPKLNAVYNFCDEDLKSRDYKILKNHIQNHDGEGAYFTIENGVRVYSFLACDGYLAPIWHGIDRYTQYPDHTRKLKITVTEDMRMREEIQAYNSDKKVGSLLTWALIISIVLFGLNVWWAVSNYDSYTEMQDKVHASAFKCAELTSMLNEQYAIKIGQEMGLLNQNQAPEGEVQDLSPKTMG